MSILGNARVSTGDQNLAGQKRLLQAAGSVPGVRERSPARPSIADFELPSWEKVKAKFQKGGILIGNGAISLVRTRFHSRHSSEP
jgi:hypothetical protein